MGISSASQVDDRWLGQRVTIEQTSNLADAMRQSRALEYDAIIAPAHVTASATLHSYTLVALSGADEDNVLVGRTEVRDLSNVPGKRLYLPQQDALRSYVVKGLLAEAGIKLSQFKQVEYQSVGKSGLWCLTLSCADVSVASANEARAWQKDHPNDVIVLKAARPISGSVSILVRKDVCAVQCSRFAQWAASPDGVITGIGRFRVASPDAAKDFVYVASLGITTPPTSVRAKVVSASEVTELLRQGASVIDTRTAKEFGIVLRSGTRGAIHE